MKQRFSKSGPKQGMVSQQDSLSSGVSLLCTESSGVAEVFLQGFHCSALSLLVLQKCLFRDFTAQHWVFWCCRSVYCGSSWAARSWRICSWTNRTRSATPTRAWGLASGLWSKMTSAKPSKKSPWRYDTKEGEKYGGGNMFGRGSSVTHWSLQLTFLFQFWVQ